MIRPHVRSAIASGALAALVAVSSAALTDDVHAFGGHKQINNDGLADASGPGSFLRPSIRRDINRQHAHMDSLLNGGDDERHFDDCDFDGASKFLRNSYRDARSRLAEDRPFNATDEFGNALHTAQDFYSHSNWVEIGFPLAGADDAVQSDLVDISGAQGSLGTPWRAPAGGRPVRRAALLAGNRWDVLLNADDWDTDSPFPADWSIARHGRAGDPGGRVTDVPTLIDAEGRTRGKLLISGEGSGDEDCNVISRTASGGFTMEFDGPNHGGGGRGLNKDSPDDGQKQALHAPARALAVLQTSYEWCRLVHEAAQAEPRAKDGLLLAMWVRAGADPHPANTPCSAAPPGPRHVTVTVESIEVLDASEEEDDLPGEIQIAAALYDSPSPFRRSVHVTNRSGRHMRLDDGDFVPRTQLPAPLGLCVDRGQRPTFTLHAWENDPGGGELPHDYDNRGDDDVMPGFQHRLAPAPRALLRTASSRHLRVQYRVAWSSDAVGSPLCGQSPPQFP